MKPWNPYRETGTTPLSDADADAALEDACIQPGFGKDQFGRSYPAKLSKDPDVYTAPDNRVILPQLDMRNMQEDLCRRAKALGPIPTPTGPFGRKHVDWLAEVNTIPTTPGAKR